MNISNTLALCCAAVFGAAVSGAGAQRPSLAVDKPTINRTLSETLARTPAGVSATQLAEALDAHIITAVTASKRYVVVGRAELKNILDEQELAGSGFVETDAAEIARLRGAKYKIVTTLDHFQEERERMTFKDGPREYTKIKLRYQISGQSRVYDTTTGEIIDSSNIQFEKFDIMEAVPGAADNGAYRLKALLPELTREFATKTVSRLLAATYPAKVLRVSGKALDINQGEGFFVMDEIVDVYGPEVKVKDRDTGVTMSLPGDYLGTAKITMVAPTTSKATFSGAAVVEAGARIIKK